MLIAPAASRHSKDTIPARPRRGESPPCGQSALWKKTSTEPVGLHEIFENSKAVIFSELACNLGANWRTASRKSFSSFTTLDTSSWCVPILRGNRLCFRSKCLSKLLEAFGCRWKYSWVAQKHTF